MNILTRLMWRLRYGRPVSVPTLGALIGQARKQALEDATEEVDRIMGNIKYRLDGEGNPEHGPDVSALAVAMAIQDAILALDKTGTEHKGNEPKTLQTPLCWWPLPMVAAGLVVWVLIFNAIGVL